MTQPFLLPSAASWQANEEDSPAPIWPGAAGAAGAAPRWCSGTPCRWCLRPGSRLGWLPTQHINQSINYTFPALWLGVSKEIVYFCPPSLSILSRPRPRWQDPKGIQILSDTQHILCSYPVFGTRPEGSKGALVCQKQTRMATHTASCDQTLLCLASSPGRSMEHRGLSAKPWKGEGITRRSKLADLCLASQGQRLHWSWLDCSRISAHCHHNHDGMPSKLGILGANTSFTLLFV